MNEPIYRPRIPKNALLVTVVLVPAFGPITDIAATALEPRIVPTMIAVSEPSQSRPKATGSAPTTIDP